MTDQKNEDLLPDYIGTALKEIASMQAPVAAVDRAVELASQDRRLSSGKRNGRTIRFLRWGVLAASLAVIVGGAVFFSQPESLYAKMQEAVSKSGIIEFKSRVFGDDDKLLREIKSTVQLNPRLIRQQFPDNSIVYGDVTKRRGLRIDHSAKTATHFPLTDGTGPTRELFDSVIGLISNGEDRHAKKIGRKEVDGKTLVEYDVKDAFWNARVFIDQDSKLPQRIVIATGERSARIEAVEFSFDKPANLSLFSFDVPEGYKVVGKAFETIDDSSLVIDPAIGMSPVKFGMTTEDVVGLFGDPDVLGHPTAKGRESIDVLNYNSRGIQISVDPENGVTQIAVFDNSRRFITGDFGGVFKGGVKLGDSVKAVVKKLGKPNQAAKDGQASLIYSIEDKGVDSTLIFEDEELVGISVRRDTSKED